MDTITWFTEEGPRAINAGDWEAYGKIFAEIWHDRTGASRDDPGPASGYVFRIENPALDASRFETLASDGRAALALSVVAAQH